MGGIFISYRRDDSRGTAGRLYDDLTERFGKDRVFRDIDALGIGVDYAVAIHDFIAGCDGIVVVIGNHWVDARDGEGRRRLEDPTEVLTAEIVTALERGKPVLPVLVEDAEMPPASQLPAALAPVSRLNALRISDDRWDYDVGRLVARLEQILPAAPTPANPVFSPAPAPVAPIPRAEPAPAAARRRWPLGLAAAIVVVAGLVVAGAVLANRNGDTSSPPETTVTSALVATTVRLTTTSLRVTSTTTATPARETSVSLSPSSGPVGTSITVSGQGFSAGETVEIRFSVTQLATVVTNRAGAFSGVVIKVPAGSPKGFPFSVTATGRTSVKSASAPFTVT